NTLTFGTSNHAPEVQAALVMGRQELWRPLLLLGLMILLLEWIVWTRRRST
ncbi:MAG: hypothetical protein ACI9MC_003663, partial [Kiritimatiellia bacterium]